MGADYFVMLKIPQVTLCCVTGIGYQEKEHLEALKKSCLSIEFGEVKYIQLESIKDIDSWNKAIIYELPKYINTTHALLVHGDGYISNYAKWDEGWLEYDYIGAPWPLPGDDYSYRTPSGLLIRVGNSVSLRSKKLMDLVATRPMEYHYGNNNEDGQICVWEREWLEEQGCKFAPLSEAVKFGKEHELPEHKGIESFTFHQI